MGNVIEFSRKRSVDVVNMTEYQVQHCSLLFAALFITETWTHVVEMKGNQSLYARTRAVVVFDRVINGQLGVSA